MSCTDSSSSSSSSSIEDEENFLRSCRNGDIDMVKDLIARRDAGQLNFELDCKGKSKSNLGWTPLHLATYFGHSDVMKNLLTRNIDVNAVNDNGDTALHKAAFIGREDLVMILLQNYADVDIINGEGRLPRDMTPANEIGQEINKLLRAAEATERLKRESKMLTAAREGDLKLLNELVRSSNNYRHFFF